MKPFGTNVPKKPLSSRDFGKPFARLTIPEAVVAYNDGVTAADISLKKRDRAGGSEAAAQRATNRSTCAGSTA